MARTKPCDFCAQDQIWNQADENGFQLFMEFYPDSAMMYIGAYANKANGEPIQWIFDTPVKYCPMCGRKVGVS